MKIRAIVILFAVVIGSGIQREMLLDCNRGFAHQSETWACFPAPTRAVRIRLRNRFGGARRALS
jgi:hypothetical protein